MSHTFSTKLKKMVVCSAEFLLWFSHPLTLCESAKVKQRYHSWANATCTAILAPFHHIFQPNYPQPMEDQGQFSHQFLALLNSATSVINPLRMYQTLAREHLTELNYDYVMNEYQNAELFIDGVTDNPLTGPGSPYFNFLLQEISEWSVMGGCDICHTENTTTQNVVRRVPYFKLQLDEIPANGTLSNTFSEKFRGTSSSNSSCCC